jgi:hypothetical protein
VEKPTGGGMRGRLPFVLGTILPLLLSAIVLVRGVPQIIDAYGHSHGYPLDLQYLINGGRLITSDTPGFLYQTPRNIENFRFFYGYRYPGGYAYAPTFAYAMAPLAHVGLFTGVDIWRVGIAICTVTIALATASVFKSWGWRLAVVAAGITWEPLLTDVRYAQSGALAAAFLVGGVLLFLHNRVWGAALLGLTVFKPTVAIGPAIMVLAEKPRVLAAFCLVAALIALTPFFWIGFGPLLSWVQILVTRPIQEIVASSRLNQGLTSTIHLNGATARIVLSIAVLVLVTVCHVVHQKAGVEAAGALAICGSLIANPHALVYDWGVAFAVILLLRRARGLPFWSTDIGAGVVLILLFVAGDISWKLAAHNGSARPLLYWAVAVMVGILATVLAPRSFGSWLPRMQPAALD